MRATGAVWVAKPCHGGYRCMADRPRLSAPDCPLLCLPRPSDLVPGGVKEADPWDEPDTNTAPTTTNKDAGKAVDSTEGECCLQLVVHALISLCVASHQLSWLVCLASMCMAIHAGPTQDAGKLANPWDEPDTHHNDTAHTNTTTTTTNTTTSQPAKGALTTTTEGADNNGTSMGSG